MKFNRLSSITEASEPKKRKRGDRFEDRILVSKLKESAPVVRYERQQRAFEKLQSTLKQMNESEALTEHRFKCGVCKENKLVCAADRNSDGKLKYFKTKHYDNCLNFKRHSVFHKGEEVTIGKMGQFMDKFFTNKIQKFDTTPDDVNDIEIDPDLYLQDTDEM